LVNIHPFIKSCLIVKKYRFQIFQASPDLISKEKIALKTAQKETPSNNLLFFSFRSISLDFRRSAHYFSFYSDQESILIPPN
jgi:hypothetical protein